LRDLVRDTIQDPDEAYEYLLESLRLYEEEGNLDAFLLAIRTVTDAQGGMTSLAEKTGLNRQHLYRSLAKNGNPTMKTLHSILNALGLKFSIERAS
jgi:probable addiction module antidote protein